MAQIQTQHDEAFQRVAEGSVVGSAASDVPGLEELSEDGALFQAMSDDDPDLAPEEWAQSDDATAVALRPPPPPDLPKVLPAKIECTDAERAQVQAWDLRTRCKLCIPGVRKGWPLCIRQRLKGSSLKGAESCSHSQEHSLQVHVLSGSFSLEEGWTLVRRRKEKKTAQEEEKK